MKGWRRGTGAVCGRRDEMENATRATHNAKHARRQATSKKKGRVLLFPQRRHRRSMEGQMELEQKRS